MKQSYHFFPKISIVTVNYNKAKYLERTIKSVLDQGYPNLEYVVIDGGSTDGSVEIIKKYEDKLAYWVSEPDNGMYFALKKGFEHTTGEILAWINSDDMYHRNALFVVAEIFTRFHNVDWIVGTSTHWDDDDRCVNAYPSRYFNHTKFLMGDYKYVQQESTFWRRSLYDKVGGIDTCYKLAGDFSLWMKFTRHTKLFIVHALIGGFRICREDQLSKDQSTYSNEVKEIIAKERIEDTIAKEIKSIKKKNRILGLIGKCTRYWINSERIKNRLFKEAIEEERHQHIIFDSKRYEFVTR